ncbi:MAG: methyl-accepting chemotaxis protein [Pseudomonadota bacterium]
MPMHLTLGKRIASGIMLMLLLMALVGVFGFIGLNRVLKVVDQYKNFNTIRDIVSSVKENSDSYLLANYSGEIQAEEKAEKEVLLSLDNGSASIAIMRNQSGTTGNGIMEKLEAAQKVIEEYRAVFNAYISEEPKKAAIKSEINAAHQNIMSMIKKGLWMEDIDVAGKLLFAGYKAYTNKPSPENWVSLQNDLAALTETIDKWFKVIENVEKLREVASRFKAAQEMITASLGNYHETEARQKALIRAMEEHKAALYGICENIGATSLESLKTETGKSITLIFSVIIAAFLLGTIFAVLSTKKIVQKLSGAIKGIDTGAGQVVFASGQVLLSSQSLAEGASEQAASLGETSSSMEEMSSMTRQNANNAHQADAMMKQVRQVVDKANASMSQLTTAMQGIAEAGQETSKIIKTIDEIAFQTNLLALNASVEAARAGEAGAGFAVVASEVRNLAIRAADAAKNTAALIEDTVKKVTEGTTLVKTTSGAFDEVAGSGAKVGELISDIAAASNEQTEGIGRVNISLAQMDSVIQRNAAIAKESADASAELNTQAEEMKRFVAQLAAMLGEKTTIPLEQSDTARRSKCHGNALQAKKEALPIGNSPLQIGLAGE